MRLMDERRRETGISIGLLILRAGAGIFLMTHGWGKLQRVLAGQWDAFGDPIGIGTGPSLALATGAEFFCALLVVLGLFTRWAAIPPVVTMAVAAFVAHGGDPWTAGAGARLFQAGEAASWASKEPALLFLTCFLALVFTGPGQYSLDHWRAARNRR